MKTYTVSVKNKSFFKAYEIIKAGAMFDVVMRFDEEVLTEDAVNALLSKCGLVGVGAFRQRFGKFEWI